MDSGSKSVKGLDTCPGPLKTFAFRRKGCYHHYYRDIKERKGLLKIACNVGGLDRGTRIILGASLILISYLGLLPRAWLAYISYAGGAVLLATGAIRWCPFNQLIGINTCDKK